MAVFRFEIPGAPSKNSREIVQFGKRPALSKPKKLKEWERGAFVALRDQLHRQGVRAPLAGDVEISGVVYYKTRASDLDISAIQDVIQGPLVKTKLGRGSRRAGLVIENDKQVVAYGRWKKRLDPQRPRVELVVLEVGPEQERLGL